MLQLTYKQKREQYYASRRIMGNFQVFSGEQRPMNTYQVVYKKASNIEAFGYAREIEGLIEASSKEAAANTAKGLLQHTERYADMIADGFELVAQGALTPIDIVLRLKNNKKYLMREITNG